MTPKRHPPQHPFRSPKSPTRMPLAPSARVDAARHDELLKRPDAAQAEMGTGRNMGPGWINVSAESVRDDEQLAFWIKTAMDFNRAVTSLPD